MACDAKTLITAGYAAGFGKLSYRHLKECILACACSQDPAAIDWANRVVANGGAAPSVTTMSAASNFMRSIATIKSRIYHLNFIAPDSIIAMRTPLVKIAGFDPWVSHTVGAGFAETIGVGGWRGYADANNGIVYDTGIDPSVIPSFGVTNGGISCYAPEALLINKSVCLVGCQDNALLVLFRIAPSIAVTKKTQVHIFDAASSILVNNPCGATPCGGFYMGSRSAVNRLDFYYASSTQAWSSVANSVVNNAAVGPVSKVAAGGEFFNPGYSICPQMLSFMAVHDGFSSADGQILFNAVQALRVALGGGFI